MLDPRPLLVWERQIELQEQIGQEDGIKEAIEEKETIVLLVGRDLVVQDVCASSGGRKSCEEGRNGAGEEGRGREQGERDLGSSRATKLTAKHVKEHSPQMRLAEGLCVVGGEDTHIRVRQSSSLLV